GPTGYGNSPYQSLSSFAGNVLLISPERLVRDGLLRASDCDARFSSEFVDYASVIPFKHRLLEKAWAYFKAGERRDLSPDYQEFCENNSAWLEDYGLFRALKGKYQGACYLDWSADIVARRPGALARV